MLLTEFRPTEATVKIYGIDFNKFTIVTRLFVACILIALRFPKFSAIFSFLG
jgi:hypothetical protein